jgi:hypothetical protein
MPLTQQERLARLEHDLPEIAKTLQAEISSLRRLIEKSSKQTKQTLLMLESLSHALFEKGVLKQEDLKPLGTGTTPPNV